MPREFQLATLYEAWNKCTPCPTFPALRRILDKPDNIITHPYGYVYQLSSYVSPYNDLFVGFQLRSFEGKTMLSYWPSDYPKVGPAFYGLNETWKDFKFGTTIILTEGPKDALSIKRYYPWVLGILTDSPYDEQVDFISTLTSSVVIMLDDDKAGHDGLPRAQKRFKYKNINAQGLFLSNADPGEALTNQAVDNQLKLILRTLGILK